MKKSNISLTNGPLLPNIIKFTVPIILTSVLQLLFNAADLVVVGKFCGSLSLGAVGATGAITNLLINLFIGISIGAGVSVAHAYGCHDDRALHRTVHTAIPTAILSGIIITVMGLVLAEPLLRVLGTPDNILHLSVVYMKIYFAGMTFNMVYNFSASILRAAGDSKSPLIFLTIAGVINVLLNLVFVIFFKMNVAGVALATSISQGVSAVLVVVALMQRSDGCKLMFSKMRFYKPQLMKIIRIGLPAGIQGSLFSFSNVIIQSSINSFGAVAMSGSSAAGNIEAFVYVSLNAFNQSAVNFTGQNLGARKYDRVFKSLWLCLICVSIVGLVGGFAAYIFGPQLLSIYISDSAEAITHGMVRIACICLPYFICGIMDVTTGALRGIGASMVPMIISVLGICGIRIIWIYTVFQSVPTPMCLYLSFPISWIITSICQVIAYLYVYRNHRKDDMLSHNQNSACCLK